MRVTELHFPSFSSANAPRRREKRCKNYGGLLLAVGQRAQEEEKRLLFRFFSSLLNLIKIVLHSLSPFFLCFFLLLLLSEFCVCFRWKGKGGIVGGASVGYVPKGRTSGGMGAVCGWARELNLHSGGPPVAVLFPAEAEQQEQI
jgi:hypothetical protein